MFLVACIFNDICNFVSIAMQHYRETATAVVTDFSKIRIDNQWLCVRVIEFARWQHPTIWDGARFAVTGTIFLSK